MRLRLALVVSILTLALGAAMAGNSYANCDNSTVQPVLNVSDFICFQSQFAAGCS